MSPLRSPSSNPTDYSDNLRFYQAVLAQAPTLHVPGMTEFELRNGTVLGLMPEKGIKRLLGSAISDPEKTSGIARAEIYLSIDEPDAWMKRALDSGAKLLAPLAARNWRDNAGFLSDPDGHVLAFAQKSPC